jgi:Rrf2 family transcriptional regulator, iron-sulfur cluster assembly transcription factor
MPGSAGGPKYPGTMQISLGRKGDYAVRAAIHLARHAGDGWRKARQIADDMAIPEAYLPQVLGELIRGRLVTSLAGPNGGYALARDPESISLLEVIEASSGPVESRECVIRGGPCRWEDTCAVHDAWSSAQTALRERLDAVTLASVANADAALERGA